MLAPIDPRLRKPHGTLRVNRDAGMHHPYGAHMRAYSTANFYIDKKLWVLLLAEVVAIGVG